MQKEENEIELGFFFKIAEENKIFIQSSTCKHSHSRYVKFEKSLFTNGFLL